jgi:photosystem II stability/assembly factor-like uncharacterized protein
MSTKFLAGQASLWVQPDGPNTEPKYLGCHSIGDIPEPKGDSTILWCPDPARSGKFIANSSFRGEPGTITTSIETDIRKTADYLEDLAINGCPFPLYIHKVSCGRRDVFSNFDRSFVLRGADVTSSTLSKLASRNPADEGESMQSFDISVQEVIRVFNMEMSRVSISETEEVTGIAACGESRCEGDCGASQKPEDYLWLSSKALVGSTANTADVLRSVKGAAFTATTSDPFAGGMDIQGIVCFQMSRDVTRILVANGTTQAAHPAEIAYSDDAGASWTVVHLGTVNAEFVADAKALYAQDRYHIWAGTSDGRIYFSSDAGVSWTVQENAVISGTDIMAIHFSDDQYGMAIYTGGHVATTSDGGSTWSAGTISGVTNGKDIHVLSQYAAWAVGSGGMVYTTDAGTTWMFRNTSNIAAIDFYSDLIGFAVGGTNTNDSVFMTIDGGYDWNTLPAVANSGFNNVMIISPKLAYVVGKINSATGFVGKIQPQ